ncbi:MAG: hypothetical protein GQ534_09405 [Candidatus Delongbacteria bacterium]|nr:hypothetical protein [Candidatus Delongbacteria bacterium]
MDQKQTNQIQEKVNQLKDGTVITAKELLGVELFISSEKRNELKESVQNKSILNLMPIGEGIEGGDIYLRLANVFSLFLNQIEDFKTMDQWDPLNAIIEVALEYLKKSFMVTLEKEYSNSVPEIVKVFLDIIEFNNWLEENGYTNK